MLKTVNSVATTYVYDPLGRLAAEYGPASAIQGTFYFMADWVGTARLVTDTSGATVGGRSAACFQRDDGERLKYTGKERDAETGLDHFGARYFSGAQGRWTSPDAINLTDERYRFSSSCFRQAPVLHGL